MYGGNFKTKIEYPYTPDKTIPLPAPTNTVDYTYGDTNWKDKLTKFNGKTITYDAIGNPISYDGYTYTWEWGRQLGSMTGNGKTISYKYNDSGIRTQKTVNNITTNYRLVGDKVTYEDNGADKIYYTYDSSGSLVSMNLNGVEYYYIRNAQNDIIGLFDNDGNQIASYTYDSWGKLISIKDGNGTDITNDIGSVGHKNPYRYRGYRYDAESGLYYLQSRYYNPDWGRFINMDSIGGRIGDLLSHNVFAYCENNPIMRSDSSGQFWETLVDIVSAFTSLVSFAKDPSWSTFGYLAWDVGAVVAPGVPGSYVAKGAKTASKAFRVAEKASSSASGVSKGRNTLYHYTNEKGLKGILKSNQLNPSLKAVNPNDVRYGNGQYLSDIIPETNTPAQLSRKFINNPFQGKKYNNFIEIDVTDLEVIKGRDGVFVIPNEVPLDITNRVIRFGPVK